MTLDTSSWSDPSQATAVPAAMYTALPGQTVTLMMAPIGIALSEPTRDPILVRSQLNYFCAMYPDQLFRVDSSDLDESKVVISWIPSWLAPIWANGLLFQAFCTSFSWAPWPNLLNRSLTDEPTGKPPNEVAAASAETTAPTDAAPAAAIPIPPGLNPQTAMGSMMALQLGIGQQQNPEVVKHVTTFSDAR